jgi:hypothetical protein
MIVCQLTRYEWDRLTSAERDAVRLGFNTFEVPTGARVWFENEWAWLLQKQRFEKNRALELRLTGVAPMVTLDERIFLAAFERWLGPKKEVQRVKKMLRFVPAWLRSLFTGFGAPTHRRVYVE